MNIVHVYFFLFNNIYIKCNLQRFLSQRFPSQREHEIFNNFLQNFSITKKWKADRLRVP